MDELRKVIAELENEEHRTKNSVMYAKPGYLSKDEGTRLLGYTTGLHKAIVLIKDKVLKDSK